LALLLVALNAFFVAAEFAMVKVRTTRLETLQARGGLVAKWAYTIVQELNAYLSAVQLGVTLSSLGLGWVGEPAFARLLHPLLDLFDLSARTQHGISYIVAFTIITILHLVLGELVPKQIAIQKAERVLMVVAVPMRLFYWTFYPFLRLLIELTNGIVKLMGFHMLQEDAAHDEEEIRLIVEDSYEGGSLSPRKASLLENVLEFTHHSARFIMHPRQEIYYLDLKLSTEENLRIAKESQHTRFPLCDGGLDRVIGMIIIKDLIWQFEDANLINLYDLKRPILIVPENKPIDQLLREFQVKKIHMAVVVDEFGATTGLITLEDVLEELVGDIQDEYDQEQPKIHRQGDKTFIVDGSALIREVERQLEIALFDPHNISIGGYFVDRLGHLAKEGDAIEIPPYRAKVLEVKNRRVVKLLFEKLPEDSATA
jgi:CBS domain containing-hemolysin-like protein